MLSQDSSGILWRGSSVSEPIKEKWFYILHTSIGGFEYKSTVRWAWHDFLPGEWCSKVGYFRISGSGWGGRFLFCSVFLWGGGIAACPSRPTESCSFLWFPYIWFPTAEVLLLTGLDTVSWASQPLSLTCFRRQSCVWLVWLITLSSNIFTVSLMIWCWNLVKYWNLKYHAFCCNIITSNGKYCRCPLTFILTYFGITGNFENRLEFK